MESIVELGPVSSLLVLGAGLSLCVHAVRGRVGPLRWVAAMLRVIAVDLVTQLLAGSSAFGWAATDLTSVHAVLAAVALAAGTGYVIESVLARPAGAIVAVMAVTTTIGVVALPTVWSSRLLAALWITGLAFVAFRLRSQSSRVQSSLFGPRLRHEASGVMLLVVVPLVPLMSGPWEPAGRLFTHVALLVVWWTLATPWRLGGILDSSRALLLIAQGSDGDRDPRIHGDAQLTNVVAAVGADAAVLVDGNLPIATAGSAESRERLLAVLGAVDPDGLDEQHHPVSGGTWMVVSRTSRGLLAYEFGEVVGLIGSDEVALLSAVADRFEIALDRADTRRRDAAAMANLRAADRMRDDFLATLSHELRTPLTSIRGFSEVLAVGSLGEEQQRDLLRRIANNASELESTVAALLELTEVRGRSGPGRVASYDLGDLVSRVVVRHTQVLSGREVAVAVPPVHVSTDGAAVTQILDQLLENIGKFTPEGTRVQLVGEVGDGTVDLVVSDDGPGVPGEIRGSVFEPFVRGGEMLTRRTRGVGIGLSIAAELATQLEGDLSLDADMPAGSSFRLRLPMAHSTTGTERPVTETLRDDASPAVI